VIECAAYGDNGAAGGGIASNYVISLYSTIVADNMAIAASGRAYGGGAASFYNLVKVVDSTISGNTAIGDPAQAEIQEHLGDALFTSGRRFEARFAWSAALATADDEETARLKSKIASGLTKATAAP